MYPLAGGVPKLTCGVEREGKLISIVELAINETGWDR
jgi:hypothetical protein